MTALQIAGLCFGAALVGTIIGFFAAALCVVAKCADCRREMWLHYNDVPTMGDMLAEAQQE